MQKRTYLLYHQCISKTIEYNVQVDLHNVYESNSQTFSLQGACEPVILLADFVGEIFVKKKEKTDS